MYIKDSAMKKIKGSKDGGEFEKVIGRDIVLLWARGSVPICRDGLISKWRFQSMY